jgi:hypothetical protein
VSLLSEFWCVHYPGCSGTRQVNQNADAFTSRKRETIPSRAGCVEAGGQATLRDFRPDLWLRRWLPRSAVPMVLRGAERRGSSRRISARPALPCESQAAEFARRAEGRFLAPVTGVERASLTNATGGRGTWT